MKNFTLKLVMGYYLPLLKANKYIILDDISTGLQILFYCPLCLLSLTKVKGSQRTFCENMGRRGTEQGGIKFYHPLNCNTFLCVLCFLFTQL